MVAPEQLARAIYPPRLRQRDTFLGICLFDCRGRGSGILFAMAEAKQGSSGRESPIEDQLSKFRFLDVLLGVNQACSETAHQLRVAHLYQLRKDQQSFRQKLAGLAVFLVVLIPSLSSLIEVPILRVSWIIAVALLAGLYLLVARDKLLKKEIQREYEDIDLVDHVVRSSQANLLRDYIYGYCSRHDILYHLFRNAGDFEKQWVLNALDSYQDVFKRVKNNLLDLRGNKSSVMSDDDYKDFVRYIEVCENRYRQLKSQHISEAS